MTVDCASQTEPKRRQHQSARASRTPPPFTPDSICTPSALPVAAVARCGADVADKGKEALTFPTDPHTGGPGRVHYRDPGSCLKVYADEHLLDPAALLLEMDDPTVATALIALGIWFERGGGCGGKITKTRLHVREVLDFRGIRKHQRGGYRREQKETVAEEVYRLNQLWIGGPVTVYEQKGRRRIPKRVDLLSRFLEVSYEREIHLPCFGEGDLYAFRIAPGEWAEPYLDEPNKQYAILLRPVMRYNPTRQNLAMRLGIYLTFQWRIRGSTGNYKQPWTAETLWRAACKQPDPKHPARSRKELEDALDTLQKSGVIAFWEYERKDEPELWDAKGGSPARGWLQKWLRWTIRIGPPPAVLEHYRDLSKGATARSKKVA